MEWLRTNTATRITVGPFIGTDGLTPVVSLTVTSEKLTFVVDASGVPTLVLDTNPTASAGNNDMVHITGDDAGYFDLELAAADVNYLGRAKLALQNAAVHMPVFHEFMILPQMIYDALVLGTDRLDVNVTHVTDTAQTAGDIFASLTTALNRIGAFAGSGVNTILGFFRAIARSDASNPSDMSGTYDPTLHSLQAQYEGGITISDIINGIFDPSTPFGKSVSGLVAGTVTDGAFTPTTTEFEANDITDTNANDWKNVMGVFANATTTAALQQKRFKITAYSKVGSNGHFTVELMGGGALPTAPVNGDLFVLV